jgi:tetratricopeptide (TPR) repeat protein
VPKREIRRLIVAGNLRRWYEKQDRVSIFISIFVFLISCGIYLRTMAPTVSFWDCGEFIACANILGIPHPPGSPLFVLIGRLSTLVPIFDQIAARVNLISVLTSALAVWITYLVIVKLTGRWGREETSLWIRLGRHVGAIAGSLFLAFSMTFWSNAVEAEVYGLSMFLMMLMVYLALIWMDHRAAPKGDKLLILIAYLGLLSTGIHMTIFLVMPAIFLLVVLTDRRKLLDWRFWITGLVLALVIHSVVPFLIVLGAWFLMTLMLTLSSNRRNEWALFFFLTCAGVMGYSVQAFIPIRSSNNPAIDENNPSDWASFKGFLERKQYGQESMIGRMFHRRGTWKNQFGAKERMGFWGFFREQYTHKGLWFVPLFLGLFGIWEQIRMRKREGVVLLFLILACTVGLVLYMNFADGTQLDQTTREIIRLEVRDRDYFFSPGFMFFALAIGLGAFGLVRKLGNLAEKGRRPLQAALAVVVAVLLVLPLLALKKNYNRNDRTGNWIPYDYAYNHLMSCDPDGMLITNGDNDTFPLWFLQNVEKIRQDVRVINLSLLNGYWYILQLRNVWNVPMNLSDEEIKGVPTRMQEGIVVPRPRVQFYDQIRDEKRFLFPFYDQKTKRFMRVQDQMVEQILLANEWKSPFYFSRTTPSDSRVWLDDHVVREGLVHRVVPEAHKDMLDPERFKKNILEIYQYRGLADMNVYKDETTVGLLMNYSERFIELADYYLESDRKDEATAILERSVELMPDYYRTYLKLYKLYLDDGKQEKADSLLESYQAWMQTVIEKSPEIVLYYQYLGLAYQAQEKFDEAEGVMERAYRLNPADQMTFQMLRQLYLFSRQANAQDSLLSREKQDKLVRLLEDWLDDNPGDAQSRQMLQRTKGQ